MSQQFRIVNVTKHEFIDPASFGALPTLLSLASAKLPATALMVLMANSLGQVRHYGRDDLKSTSAVPGSWAGDTIIMAGEYADLSCVGEEECRLPDASNINLHNRCVPFHENTTSEVPWSAQITDITPSIMAALMDDSQLETDLRESISTSGSENAEEALAEACRIRMKAQELKDWIYKPLPSFEPPAALDPGAPETWPAPPVD